MYSYRTDGLYSQLPSESRFEPVGQFSIRYFGRIYTTWFDGLHRPGSAGLVVSPRDLRPSTDPLPTRLSSSPNSNKTASILLLGKRSNPFGSRSAYSRSNFTSLTSLNTFRTRRTSLELSSFPRSIEILVRFFPDCFLL